MKKRNRKNKGINWFIALCISIIVLLAAVNLMFVRKYSSMENAKSLDMESIEYGHLAAVKKSGNAALNITGPTETLTQDASFQCKEESHKIMNIEENLTPNASAPQEDMKPQQVFVEGLDFERLSRTQIRLFWQEISNVPIEKYILQKRNTACSKGTGEWESVSTIRADEIAGQTVSVTDSLDNPLPQQYEYRVLVESGDRERYIAAESKPILASNVMVCIDPGHYAGENEVEGELSYGYAEGDFTLRIATTLRQLLRQKYGIDVYMTREGGSITLGGYTDILLDKTHIRLRGEYAAEKDSDLFISLHTNANSDMANGYEQCLQPTAIGKTVVILGMKAMEKDHVIGIANAIGVNLSHVNYRLGLSTVDSFRTASRNDVMAWTSAYNDSLDAAGAVVCRISKEQDYYGILKGASGVGVPGIIVEHSFHTVAEVRRQAMETDLYAAWADSDAYGIAYGFGFVADINGTSH